MRLKQANQPALQMPRLKKAADWVDVDWKAFAEELGRRITSGRAGSDPRRVAALVSPSLPLETIAMVRQFLKEVVGSDRVGLAAGPELAAVAEVFGTNGKTAPLARLSDLEDSDLVVAHRRGPAVLGAGGGQRAFAAASTPARHSTSRSTRARRGCRPWRASA